MGLMDAFQAEERIPLRISEVYGLLEAASEATAKARYLTNAISCEVPYRYIREIMTGQKDEDDQLPFMNIHEDDEDDDLPFPDPVHEEGITDCAPEGVDCDECPHPCEGESEVEE